MSAGVPIPFFTDQNVADSVGNFLLLSGHGLTRLRTVMPTTTKDPVIAVACSQAGQVLVSHDRDFRGVGKRLQVTRADFNLRLHRIHLGCPEPMAMKRVAEALSLIESEWLLVQPDRPMQIEIRPDSIRTRR